MEWKFNDPKKLNVMNTGMFNTMIEELKRWKREPGSSPSILLMSGVGGKAFCAGGNIRNLYNFQHSEGGKDKPKLREFFER